MCDVVGVRRRGGAYTAAITASRTSPSSALTPVRPARRAAARAMLRRLCDRSGAVAIGAAHTTEARLYGCGLCLGLGEDPVDVDVLDNGGTLTA